MSRVELFPKAAADWRKQFLYDEDAFDCGVVAAKVAPLGAMTLSPYAPTDYRTVAFLCGFNDTMAKRKARSRLQPPTPMMIAAE